MDSQTTSIVLPPPIRRLPTELITEIISYALDSGMDKKSLISVCKDWRTVVLSTPRFWRHIEISRQLLKGCSLEDFRRTLDLSGSVTLDVNLHWDTVDEDTECQLLEHLKVLAYVGIHRWRSLTLVGGWTTNDRPNPLRGVFTGKLSSLRSLCIRQVYPQSNQHSIFKPLYTLIAETQPDLHVFTCIGHEPPEILNFSPIYSNLKSIRASIKTIEALRPKFDVPELYINSQLGLDTFKGFELPHTVTFESLGLFHLSKCGLDNVQVLEVNFTCTTNSKPPVLKFSNLHKLRVYMDIGDGLTWLLDTEAPKLYYLTIIDSHRRASNVTNGIMARFFENEKHRIKMSPTQLELGIHLTVASTLRVLKQWPRIQDLTLYWDRKLKWDGKLLSGFCNKDGALCHDLHVLRVVMWPNWSREEMDEWLQAARKILRARKDVLSLWKITLTDRWGPPVSLSVTIFDIE